MWHQFKSYIQFLWKSTNQHGVHSPFVYDLVTTCFYDSTTYPEYESIKAYRENLLRNHQSLNITDLGAGSKRMSSKRKISSIVRHNSSSIKRTKLLFRLINYFLSNSILELGSSLGIGTYAMSLGNQKAKIISVEGCPNVYSFTNTYLKDNSVTNVELINSKFNKALQELNSNNPKHKAFDLVFIDGNHQKDATLNYFETLLPHIHNDSVMVFDDIYWSKGMTEAWNQIKEHPNVTVSIDTFRWGYIFFRKEQAKEHFYIRT